MAPQMAASVCSCILLCRVLFSKFSFAVIPLPQFLISPENSSWTSGEQHQLTDFSFHPVELLDILFKGAFTYSMFIQWNTEGEGKRLLHSYTVTRNISFQGAITEQQTGQTSATVGENQTFLYFLFYAPQTCDCIYWFWQATKSWRNMFLYEQWLVCNSDLTASWPGIIFHQLQTFSLPLWICFIQTGWLHSTTCQHNMIIIDPGNISKGNLSHKLPNYNLLNARPENILDHCYTTLNSAYHPVLHAALGHSDHVMAHLIPLLRLSCRHQRNVGSPGMIRLYCLRCFQECYQQSGWWHNGCDVLNELLGVLLFTININWVSYINVKPEFSFGKAGSMLDWGQGQV